MEVMTDSKINSNNNKILLVDDEIDITAVFELGLEDNGFEVDSFNDPLEALKHFRNGLYDLALLDYRMPSMNGFDLYQKIREMDQKIKVCFITAFDIYHNELARRFENSSQTSLYKEDSGCIIHKPIEIDDLIVRIRERLRQ